MDTQGNLAYAAISGLVPRLDACIRFGALAGSRARGRPDPNSNMDLLLITDQEWCQRISWRHLDIDVDAIVGPLNYFEAALVQEKRFIVPFIAGARPIYGEHSLGLRLIEIAQGSFSRGFQDLSRLVSFRDLHRPYSALLDFCDVADDDPVTANLIAWQAIATALNVLTMSRREWPQGMKPLGRSLDEKAPDVAARLRQFMSADSATEKAEHLRDVLDACYRQYGAPQSEGSSARLDWRTALAAFG
jgi:hypothetical protein